MRGLPNRLLHCLHSLHHRALQPVSALPLVIFRITFGLLMFAGAARFVLKGWVESQYLQPDFHFTYLPFGWVHPLPGAGLYLLFAMQMVCALLIASGRAYRPAALGFFLAFTYVELLDQATYLNHYYFVSLIAFLLVVLPLDRWGRLELAPRWILSALRLQVGIVYLFAGIAKLNPDWLVEALPLRIWLSARSGLPVVGALVDEPAVAYAMSWGGAAFDLSIPFLLAWRRTRPWAFLAVVGFHGLTGALFPIGMFPWIMIVAAALFFEGDDWMRMMAFARRMARLAPAARFSPAAQLAPAARLVDAARPTPAARTAPSRGLLLLFIAWFAVQLLVPLRHLAYPGPVLWTEEGTRFSWRVMVVEKTGSVVFHMKDPASGRSWEVFPGTLLTPQQEKQMAFQPDMILQFAHHLRDRYGIAESIAPDVEVRVEAFVSLNGRAAARLIDPEIDLARVERGWGAKPWILAPGWR